jgi:RHS repeat-associated protein
MKKLLILFALLLCLVTGYSQKSQDIFKQNGYKKEMLTLTKGKYKETFYIEEVMQVGTVLINTKTNQVVKFLEEDNTDSDTTYNAEHACIWLSPDPLGEKDPWNSPYVFCNNNPVKYIDPDGCEWWDIVAGIAIGVATNLLPGTFSIRELYQPTDAEDYNNALRNTDVAAAAVGEIMQQGGTATAVVAGTVAATSAVASAAIVDAPVTVPVAAGAAAVAVIASETAVAGTMLMFNSAVNTSQGYNYGEKSSETEGTRTKNRLPDKGEPNSTRTNSPGTTTKKYGPDGNVQKEFNKGHPGKNTPKNEQKDHIHDYKPNPNNPTGRGDRQPGRPVKKNELDKDFK